MAAMSCASDIGGAPSPPPWAPVVAGKGGEGGVAGRPCLSDLCLVALSRCLANTVVQATMSSSRRTCATACSSVAYSSSTILSVQGLSDTISTPSSSRCPRATWESE
uniref:Uncharacterized protein n=1 Tax=Arundo donax TaxID=35708 RepID=A0A0A9FVX0_ARUDO